MLFRALLRCPVAAASLALAAAVPSTCRSAGAPPPDLLLLTIDTLRADHLGCWGDPSARTPTLDRLARRGVQYQSCEAQVPLTFPSHTAMLTGLTPPENGVRNNGTYELEPGVPVLAEELGRAGWRTGAFVAAFPLASECGLDRGFDEYDDDLPVSTEVDFYLPERPGGEVVDSAVRWTAGQPSDARVFVWAHLFEPHFPYEPPPALAALYRGTPYDGEIAQADRLAARLIARIGAARGRTPVVIAASDHGEGLGDHGEATHGLFVFESTLHVMLIVSGAPVPAGEIVTDPVALVDVAPTALRLAGLDPSPLLHGTNAVLRPWGKAPARAIYSETLYPLESYGWSPAFALREGSRKVILSARRRSYALDADPGERNNRAGRGAPEWSGAMLDDLERRVGEEQGGDDAATRTPSPEEMEALAALGYTGGLPASGGGGSALLDAVRDRPDMEDVLPAVEATTRAANAVEGGHPEQAIAPLRSVLERYPESLETRLVLGQALLETDDKPGALEQFEAADGMQPNDAGVALTIARLRRDAGDREGALEPYERSIRLVGKYRSRVMEAAECEALAGRSAQGEAMLREARDAAQDPLDVALLDEALRRLGKREKALGAAAGKPADRDHPADAWSAVLLARYDQWQSRWDDMLRVLGNAAFDGNAEVHLYRGVALHRLGNVPAALAEYTKAATMDDTLHLAHNNRAWILATGGRPGEALASARRAVELLPSEPEYRDTLVEVLERLGRKDEARKELSRALAEFPSHAGLRARVAPPG